MKKDGWRFGCLLFSGGLIIVFCLIISFIFFGIFSIFDTIADEIQQSQNKEVIEYTAYNNHQQGNKEIAVIELNNVILPSRDINFIKEALEKILQDKGNKIIGVILSLDTPGGEVTLTDEIYQIIQKIRQTGVKVVTCMHSVAASGGYYLAAGTDYIIANKHTITGSIGVILSTVNFYKLANKYGVEAVTIKSGIAKDSLHPLQPVNEESRKVFQALVDESYKSFARIVSDGRKIDYNLFFDEKSPYSTAQVFSGQQALKLKLVDEIGYFDDAVQKIKELTKVKDPQIYYYRPAKTFKDYFNDFSIGSQHSELLNQFSKFRQILPVGRLYYQALGVQ